MRSLKLKTANYKLETDKKGFTLVELIVSVGVFSIVMLVAVGALLSLLAANQRAQTLKVVMNNLNLAMENMVKDIRVGTVYHCGGSPYNTAANCSAGDSTFAFKPSGGSGSGDEIVYQLSNGAILRSVAGNNPVAITSSDVTVERLAFKVWGAGDDNKQPRVKIVITGVAGVDEDTQTDFNVQTTATQRLIDS